MIETKQKYSYSIDHSENTESPREWCNISKMVLMHNRYDLPYETDLSKGYLKSLDGWDEVKRELVYAHGIYPTCIKPVYMYDHGGISVSTTGFSCGGDSGQVGYIFVDKATIKKEEITKKTAIAWMLGDLQTYDQYIRGDVFDVVICDESGEIVDIVCGFYCYDHAEDEAKSLLEYWNKKEFTQ